MGRYEVTNQEYADMLNWALDPNEDGNTLDSLIEVNPLFYQGWVRTKSQAQVNGSFLDRLFLLYLDGAATQIEWNGSAFFVKSTLDLPAPATDRSDHQWLVFLEGSHCSIVGH